MSAAAVGLPCWLLYKSQLAGNVNSQHTNEQHASKGSQLANNTSRTPKSAANGVDRSVVYFKMTTHTFDFNKKNCDTRYEDGDV